MLLPLDFGEYHGNDWDIDELLSNFGSDADAFMGDADLPPANNEAAYNLPSLDELMADFGAADAEECLATSDIIKETARGGRLLSICRQTGTRRRLVV